MHSPDLQTRVVLAKYQISFMATQPKSVLIVDDNSNVRSALHAFMERTMGMFVCDSAQNGIEAIRKAEEQRPNLVLIDLSMPKMNGLDAAVLIRKALPEARIVIFTLFSDSLGELLARAVGVDLIVSKAEGVAGLLRALDPFLQSRHVPAGGPPSLCSPAHYKTEAVTSEGKDGLRRP